MKTRFTVLSLVALTLAATMPAIAQSAAKYDPIMEKRADLRLKWLHNVREAAASAIESDVSVPRIQRDAQGNIVIPANGASYLLDFQIASSKRGDIRLAWIHDGLDVAYTNWLRRDRPFAFQQVERGMMANAASAAKKQVARQSAR